MSAKHEEMTSGDGDKPDTVARRSAQERATDVKQGYLEKKSSGMLGTKWQKRFFMLTANHELHYAEKQDSKVRSSKGGSISGCTVEKLTGSHEDGGHEREIKVSGGGKSKIKFHVRAETATDSRVWYEALSAAVEAAAREADDIAMKEEQAAAAAASAVIQSAISAKHEEMTNENNRDTTPAGIGKAKLGRVSTQLAITIAKVENVEPGCHDAFVTIHHDDGAPLMATTRSSLVGTTKVNPVEMADGWRDRPLGARRAGPEGKQGVNSVAWEEQFSLPLPRTAASGRLIFTLKNKDTDKQPDWTADAELGAALINLDALSEEEQRGGSVELLLTLQNPKLKLVLADQADNSGEEELEGATQVLLFIRLDFH